MIVIVNSLKWPFLFKSREAESSGKPLKQNQLGEERQPVLSSVLTYCASFQYFWGDGCCIQGAATCFILPVLIFYTFVSLYRIM